MLKQATDMTPNKTIWGIDGCKDGWVCIGLFGDGFQAEYFPDLRSFWARCGAEATRVWIDIPLGLPDADEREAEAAARALLGGRRGASVFNTPTRAACQAKTYAEASVINHAATGRKLSKQTWNIIPKIREADEFLRATPTAKAIFAEAHPEVIFCMLSGAAMRESKKTPLGFLDRLQALSPYLPQAELIVRHGLNRLGHLAKADDLLDALALAIGAGFPDYDTLPTQPAIDAHGIPMQMVYPRLNPLQQIVGVEHVQITIPTGTEDEARAFYCELLGLTEIPKPTSLEGRGGFWLRVGQEMVHVGTEDGFDRHSTKGHVAYVVRDLDHWREVLSAEGFSINESVPIPGFERFEFRDPFGNRVEFIQPAQNF